MRKLYHAFYSKKQEEVIRSINRNEKNASIDALRSLRIKFPIIKASMPIELTA